MLGLLRGEVVTVYSWPELAELGRFELKAEDIHGDYPAVAFAFSPDNRQILLGSWVEVDNGDYLTAIWEIASGKRLTTRSLQHNCSEVGFTPDGQRAWGGTTLWSIAGDARPQPFADRRPHSPYGAAAMSHDGRWMVAGNQAGEIDFWDVASGQLVDRIAPRVAAPRGMAFSDDGSTMLVNYGESGHLASPWWRQTGVVHAAGESGRKFATLFSFAPRQAIAHPDRPAVVAEGVLSPEGSQLALHNGDGGLRLMKATDGKLRETHPLSQAAGWIPSGRGHLPMAFDASGNRLLVGSRRLSRQFHLESSPDRISHGTAVIYDTQSGNVATTLRPEATEGVLSVALSRDGARAATGVVGDNVSRVSRVMLIDIGSGETLQEKTFHGSNSARHLRFTPDGKRAVVGFSGNLRSRTLLWDYDKNEVVQSFSVGGPTAIRPDSNEAVIYGYIGKPRRVNLQSGEMLGHIEQREIVNPGEFDREGGVMLCDDQNRVDLFDPFSGELLTRFHPQHNLENAWLSADAEHIVTCSRGHHVTLWKNSDTGWNYLKLVEHQMPPGRLLAIDPTAERFIYRTTDHQAKTSHVALVDARTGEQLGEFADARDLVKYSHDGKTLFAHGQHWSWRPETTLTLYDAATCELIRKLDMAPWGITGAAFHPEGRLVIVSSQLDLAQQLADDPDNPEWQSMAVEWDSVRLWDANSGEQLRTFSGHRYPVTDLQFNATADLLLSISFDRTNLWNVETGERLLSLQADGDPHRQSVATDSQLTRLVVRVGNSCDLWDLRSRKKVATFELPGNWSRGTSYLTFSDDGQWIVVGNYGFTELRRWPDREQGKSERHALLFDSPVVVAAFRPGAAKPGAAITGMGQLATCHLDGSVRLSSVPEGDEIARFYRFDDGNEWLATTRDGWIDGSPAGLSLLGWRQEGQVLHWEHLTRDRHRPNQVREAINAAP